MSAEFYNVKQFQFFSPTIFHNNYDIFSLVVQKLSIAKMQNYVKKNYIGSCTFMTFYKIFNIFFGYKKKLLS